MRIKARPLTRGSRSAAPPACGRISAYLQSLVGATDRPLPGGPLRAIQTMVERTSATGLPVSPDDRISAEAALAMWTTRAAWVMCREDRLGLHRPGFLADLAILGSNPLTTDVAGIADIEVRGTVVERYLWLA